jgi:hypothetical protein
VLTSILNSLALQPQRAARTVAQPPTNSVSEKRSTRAANCCIRRNHGAISEPSELGIGAAINFEY